MRKSSIKVKKKSKRVFNTVVRLISTAVVIASTVVLSYSAYNFYKTNKLYQKTMSILKESAYPIQYNLQLHFPTLEDELKDAHSSYKEIAKCSQELDSIEARIKEYESQFPAAKSEFYRIRKQMFDRKIWNFDGSKTKYWELMTKLSKDMTKVEFYPMEIDYVPHLDDYEFNMKLISSKIRSLKEKTIKSEESKYGNLIIFGKEVFQKLTNRQLPDDFNILIKKVNSPDNPYRIGQSHATKQLIEFEDWGYGISLTSYLHELGHINYKGEEINVFERLNNKPINEDVRFMEEAAAYLFELAGTEIVKQKHPELGKNMETYVLFDRIEKIKEYKEGSEKNHSKGWTLASAILSEFDGDAKTAFNYILSKRKLNDLDSNIINRYNSYRKRLPFDGSDVKQLSDDLIKRTKSIEIRLKALEKTYCPEISF